MMDGTLNSTTSTFSPPQHSSLSLAPRSTRFNRSWSLHEKLSRLRRKSGLTRSKHTENESRDQSQPSNRPSTAAGDSALPYRDSHPLNLKRESKNSLRRIVRRASTSIRENTYGQEQRYDPQNDGRPPSRALELLRRATSFRSRASFSSARLLVESDESQTAQHYVFVRGPDESTIYLPARTNSGGAAARAAAAAQNERRLARQISLAKDGRPVEMDQDAESGVGLDMQTTESLRGICFDSNVVRKDPITCLPMEISTQILSYLSYKDLIRAELTSRRWHLSASSYSVWRNLFMNEYPIAGSYQPSPSEPFSGGRGVGNFTRSQDWKRMFALRRSLNCNWRNGNCNGLYMLGHTDCVYCVQFDEQKIITGSRDRTIRVWDIKTGRQIKLIGPSQLNGLTSTQAVRFKPAIRRDLDSQRLPGHILEPSFVPKAQITPQTGRNGIAGLRISSSLVHHASILCLEFDSTTMVTGSSDCTCIVWDISDDYKAVQRLISHTGAVLDVCFDSRHIVSCSRDMSICTWERSSGVLLKKLMGHKGPVNAVQMRGNLVVSTSGDCLIKLWNIDSGQCIRDFAGHSRGLACVEFSDDSRYILSGGNDHVIRVWDANTGECIRQLQGHTRLVRSLHLDAANGRVTSGSYDHTVKTFDLSKGEILSDLQRWTDTWVLSSKADYRRMVCTSQDGKILMLDYGHNLPDCHLLEAS